MITEEENILNFLQSQGMIDVDVVRNTMKKNEIKRILLQHPYSIFFDEKDGRWKTTIKDETSKRGRRLIARKSCEDLESYLADFYSGRLESNEKQQMRNTYTLKDVFPKWLKLKTLQTDSPSYPRRILVDWKKYYLGTELIDIKLKDMNYFMLQEWALNLVKKYSLTKTKYYNITLIIRQCLEYASDPEIGILDRNPYERVTVSKNLFHVKQKPKSETQVFLFSEQERIQECIREKFQNRPWCTTPLMILLNFQLGLRIGELVVLRWGDIDGDYLHVHSMEIEDYSIDAENGKATFTGFRIVAHTKTPAGDREIYINRAAKEILDLIRSINEKYEYADEDFIFIECQGRKRGTAKTYQEYLRDVCISSDVRIKSNHKIRKTYISSLFDTGVNIETIRRQAGHEDERTTLHNYCFERADDTELKKSLEKATNLFLTAPHIEV